MIGQWSREMQRPLLLVLLVAGLALFATGLVARWPTAFRQIDLDLAETCQIWARLGGGTSMAPDPIAPLGRSLLLGAVIAMHQGLDLATDASRCLASGLASLSPLGPLGVLVFLLCLVPVAGAAAAIHLLTGSRRAAALAAALALSMERFSASLSDGSYGWILPSALIMLATVLLMAAACRGRFAPAVGAGFVTVVGSAMLGQVEVAAALVGGLTACVGGLLMLLRSRAAARLALGLGLGLIAGGGASAMLSQHVYGVPFPHAKFEMTRSERRLATSAPRDMSLQNVGMPHRSEALLMATVTDMTSAPWRFVTERAKDAVVSAWALGKWLLLACALYLPVTFRIARARGLVRVWAAAMLPVAVFLVDAVFGYGRSFAGLALLLPLVALPVMVWRDL